MLARLLLLHEVPGGFLLGPPSGVSAALARFPDGSYERFHRHDTRPSEACLGSAWCFEIQTL